MLTLDCYGSELPIFINNPAKWLVRIVIKHTGPILTRRLRQQFLFRFERFHGIKIVAHDPRKRHVRAHRDQIGKTKQRPAAAIQTPALHRSIMAGMVFQAQPGHYFVVRVLQFQLSAGAQRLPILRQVTRPIAIARMLRMIELRPRNKNVDEY